MMSQKKDLFVPVDYRVPTIFETDEFRLRMLSIEDVEMDYEAVMDSVTHLSKVWPRPFSTRFTPIRSSLIEFLQYL